MQVFRIRIGSAISREGASTVDGVDGVLRSVRPAGDFTHEPTALRSGRKLLICASAQMCDLSRTCGSVGSHIPRVLFGRPALWIMDIVFRVGDSDVQAGKIGVLLKDEIRKP